MVQRSIDFIIHWWSAKTLHGTHSPFVYNLAKDCLYGSILEPTDRVVRHYEKLKKEQALIVGKDFGSEGAETSKSVAYYARTSSMQEFQSEFLYRLVSYLKPNDALELGTNIGKSAAFMASANEGLNLTTVDGNSELSEFAQHSFDSLGLQNIQTISMPFENFLTKNEKSFDLVFIDGNHHYEPTIFYFNRLKTFLNPDGAIVFHDIYWSKGMKKAWQEIKKDQDVVVSLDLFFFGLVWLDKAQAKEHFKLRFPKNLFRLFF